MARRDVGFTHSVDVKDQNDSVDQFSVDAKGLERSTLASLPSWLDKSLLSCGLEDVLIVYLKMI